jgi:hypothetical protein
VHFSFNLVYLAAFKIPLSHSSIRNCALLAYWRH